MIQDFQTRKNRIQRKRKGSLAYFMRYIKSLMPEKKIKVTSASKETTWKSPTFNGRGSNIPMGYNDNGDIR